MHLRDVFVHIVRPFEVIGTCHLHKDVFGWEVRDLACKHLHHPVCIHAKKNIDMFTKKISSESKNSAGA